MNEGERRLMQFQRKQQDPNSFFGLLIKAAFKADLENLGKLRQGFPDEVEAVTRWRTEDGYAEALALEYDGGHP